MKICFLATSNSIHSYKWIRYFSYLGYEIIWISIEKQLYDMPKNVQYIEIKANFNFKFIALLKAIWVLKKTLKKSPVDFVHVHYLGFYGLMSLFVKEKLISTAWGSDVLINKKNFLKKILVKKVFNKSKIITCDAYHLQSAMINLGVSKEKIKIINFGIDSKNFSRQPLDDQLKQKLGIDNGLSIISTRGFEEIYDIQTLIKAMPIVLDNIPNTKLFLVGRGTIKSKLIKLVKELRLENNVSFIGLIPNEELPNILSNMDIYVSTSLSDAGLASSTAEAMTCEVPVVVSDSAENDKWVDDGKNGFIFPVKDYKKLAAILIKLLQNEYLRKLIGKEGRNIIVENNDYENEMNKVNEIYKQLKEKQ
jgi:glycosyltransferase involved in cell wall biosynthesis